MKNKNSIWCTIMGILGFVLGVSYCFTLILIPLAVYCFIGAKKYIDYSALTDSELALQKKSLTNWAIFFSIVGFPIGLLSLFPAMLAGNNVTITTTSEPNVGNAEAKEETVKPSETHVEDSLETIAKLENLKKEGLITEEEFERAKSEVLSKK